MYDLGAFVPQDDAEAGAVVSSRGRGRSRHLAGPPRVHAQRGRGRAADDAEAMRWYRLAADQGGRHRAAQPWFMHSEGRGVPQDDAEAMRWYRLAADQGDATAQLGLGLMYYNGEGVLKDSVLAHMWWNIASANGYEPAREVRDNLEPDMTRARSAARLNWRASAWPRTTRTASRKKQKDETKDRIARLGISPVG